MASTRLKNAPMTYNREKNTYIKSYNNRSYVGKILNDNKYLPGLGINAPYMPNGINNNILTQTIKDCLPKTKSKSKIVCLNLFVLF